MRNIGRNNAEQTISFIHVTEMNKSAKAFFFFSGEYGHVITLGEQRRYWLERWASLKIIYP